MALTRKMLKAMGIEDEKIDQIIEAHIEVTDALKAERDDFKNQAGNAEELKRQLDEALANSGNGDDEFKKKYEDEHAAFESFKSEVEAAKANRMKTDLYKDLLKSNGVDEKRIDSIVKITDLSGIEINDGQLANADKLSESIKSDWADFIATTGQRGAGVATPPGNEGTPDFDKMTDAEYYEYMARQKNN